jgi:hypothetical protein
MKSLAACLFCDGTGKCEECRGTGTKPLSVSCCTHCSGTGDCPECEGSGKSSFWGRPRGVSVLIYGFLWAAGLVGFFGLMTLANRPFVKVICMVGWTVFWFGLFYYGTKGRNAALLPAFRHARLGVGRYPPELLTLNCHWIA